RPFLELRRVMIGNAGGVGGAMDELGEFLEDMGGGEAVRLHDQLALQVAYFVEALAIGIDAVAALGKPLRQHHSMLVACHSLSLDAPYRAPSGLSSQGPVIPTLPH